MSGVEASIEGVLVASVVNNRDPKGLGRVQVRLLGKANGYWARVAVPMAGAKRGTYFLPDIDDQVLVAFEAGDPARPFVLGGLWNGQARPPASNADGQNNLRLIKSRSGHSLSLDDTPENESVTIQSKSGHKLVLSDAGTDSKVSIVDANNALSIVVDATAGAITVTAQRGDIILRAPSGRVRLEGASVELEASGLLDIQAGATVSVNGSLVKIN
jgi:phage baseplate assembly protein V